MIALLTISVGPACDTTLSTKRAVLPTNCAAGPLSDGLTPSREGFFHEVLFPAPTARTPRYDDYTPGSYHVDKLDLVKGLPEFARACGVLLDGVFVLGPVGVLWTYHVVAVLTAGDSLRVNSVVMPHARITGKATGLVAREEVKHLYTALINSKLLRAGLPRPVVTGSSRDLALEFSYDLVFVRFRGEAQEFRHGSLRQAAEGEQAEVEHLRTAIDRLLAQLAATYGK